MDSHLARAGSVSVRVKASDKVLFGKYAGSEIKLDGDECLILREDEVLGVIEGVREPARVGA